MSVAEWMLGEAAIRHIARVLDVSPGTARKELIIAAAKGSVDAVDRSGRPVQIPAIEPGSVIQPDMEYFADIFLQTYYQIRLEEVRFRRVQLEAKWPLPGATKAETSTPEAPPKPTRKGIGGAPVQYEWDRIAGEVFRRVYLDGTPEKIEPFAAEIFEWCESEFGAGKAPGDKILRERITTWLAGVRREET